MRLLSVRSEGNAICKNMRPKLYMSNLSGRFNCHRTGDKVVATGTEGADGVCVLMIYCSGAAYLGSKRNSLGI
uniref:Uncharacterized protein n=1 Tax=Arundo donax TaxID=35708 RepID=A0A0A9AJE4_ARUDO